MHTSSCNQIQPGAIFYMDSIDEWIDGLLVQFNLITKEEIVYILLQVKSCKLNYLDTDKELVAVTELLKLFHNIVYGTEILFEWIRRTYFMKMSVHKQMSHSSVHLTLLREMLKARILCGWKNEGNNVISRLSNSMSVFK